MTVRSLNVRAIVGVLLIAVFLGQVGVAADDVPDSARKNYDKARAYVAKGGEKNLKKAWSLLAKLKDKAARSVDFWELYFQVGQALDKGDDKLWSAVETREAKHPDCPSFDLLRYRFATGIEQRKGHLQKAMSKVPDDVGLKVMMVGLLIEEEDEFEAEELVDTILEEAPGNARALVMKGRLQLIQGYTNAAIEFADEHLANAQIAGLHHLKADAYLKMHVEDEKETLDDALTCAEAAVGITPDPEYVVTLARVLEKKGDMAKAKNTVKGHFEKAPSALLAALLGEYAFAAGDYKTAIQGFQVGAATNRLAARGLAMCHARLGNEKEAKAALETVMKHEPDEVMFPCYVHGHMGDYAAALAAIEASDHEDAPLARAWCNAWLGNPGAIKPKVDERFPADPDRLSEYIALCWLQGRVLEAMGANGANGARNRIRKAEVVQAKSGVASPKPAEEPMTLSATTVGLMMRVPMYVRSACGNFFSAHGEPEPDVQIDPEAQTATISLAVWGVDQGCDLEGARRFQFNAATVKGNTVKLDIPDADWGAVQSAFGEGVKKMLGGDDAGAVAEFDKGIAIEPNWHTLKVFRAAAKAFSSEGDRAGAAQEIKNACKDWPDDFTSRRLGLLIAMWANQDVGIEIDELMEREESYSERRLREI